MTKKGEKFYNWGGKHPEETKRKIGLSNAKSLKGRKLPEETKKKISLSNKGKTKSEEWRKKLSDSLKGKPHSKERIDAIISGLVKSKMQIKKTLPEIKMEKFLNEFYKGFDSGWKYTGNKKLWITLPNQRKKNPDFTNKQLKKVIEVFGDYWHRNDNPNLLIEEYKYAGWSCFIIWENQLNVPFSLIDDFEMFMGYRYPWEEK